MQSLLRSFVICACALWKLPLCPWVQAQFLPRHCRPLWCPCASQSPWASEASFFWAFSFNSPEEEWSPLPTTWLQLITFVKYIIYNRQLTKIGNKKELIYPPKNPTQTHKLPRKKNPTAIVQLLMKVYQANMPVLYPAEILNSKHKFWHDEPLPTPTTGGWTERAVVTEIQTDLNIKKWSPITVPQYLWYLFFPSINLAIFLSRIQMLHAVVFRKARL